MKLNLSELRNREQWEDAGFNLPLYDIEQIRENTKENPNWVHFGGGNIFRAYMANVQHRILNVGKSHKGIVVVGGESIETIYQAHDNLTILVTLKVDGSIEKTVIGSIVESLILDVEDDVYWNRLKEIFKSPSLQMVSFTITEKGYKLKDGQGEYLADVVEDFKIGYKNPSSYMGKITSLLYERYLNDRKPIAFVSMDNMSQNGTKLYEAIYKFAEEWANKDFIEKDFLEYIANPSLVSFPWSMIDKITPRPDPSVREMLKAVGFEDVNDLITAKNSYVAPFVNAEESEYLIIEDLFPNGRPNLEEAGVIFTDRETVDKVEKMKVSTCLNPLHTSLAIFGCLLGYELISKEMQDPELKILVEKIGYDEGFPVVVDPGIINPKEFLDEVIQVRLPNPFIPDSPQRIATDTSQKLGIRFGGTIKSYMAREDLNVLDLEFIPLVLAGWCRYLMGIDDNGSHMNLSSDPLLEEVVPYLSDISLGDKGDFHKELEPILSNANIFGVNLYDAGLGQKIEGYFAEFISDKGAVRKSLKRHLYKTD